MNCYNTSVALWEGARISDSFKNRILEVRGAHIMMEGEVYARFDSDDQVKDCLRKAGFRSVNAQETEWTTP